MLNFCKSILFKIFRFINGNSLIILFVFLLYGHGSAQNGEDAWVSGIQAPQYFAVVVKDVDKSVEWYSTVFGLGKIGGSEAEDGSWRIENLNSELLFIEIIKDKAAKEIDLALGFCKMGFQVPDVKTVADRVAKETGEAPRVLEFPEYGIRIIQLRDPDGNIIQLSSLLN